MITRQIDAPEPAETPEVPLLMVFAVLIGFAAVVSYMLVRMIGD